MTLASLSALYIYDIDVALYYTLIKHGHLTDQSAESSESIISSLK